MTLLPLDVRDAPAWVVRSGDGRSFAVFAVDGEDGRRGYRVTDAVCPHNRGPLEQGWLRADGMVVCPWHWYRFDVETGVCVTNAGYRLGVHPVVERDGAWFADIGEPPAVLSWSERLRAHARGD